MPIEGSWIPSHEELGGGILNVIDKALCWIVATALLAISTILMVQVIARYVANSPTVWSEELAVSLFVWLTMLAIPLGLRRGEHLTLDILSKRLTPQVNRMLAVVISLLTITMFVILAFFAMKLLPAGDRQLLAGISGGLGIPAKVSWIYLAVPVGAVFSVLFTVERTVLMLRGKVTVLNADADVLFIEHLDEDLKTSVDASETEEDKQ